MSESIIPHHHTGDQTFSLLLCETKVYKLCMSDQNACCVLTGLASLLSEQDNNVINHLDWVPGVTNGRCTDRLCVLCPTAPQYYVCPSFTLFTESFESLWACLSTKTSESSGDSKERKKMNTNAIEHTHSCTVSSGLKCECFLVLGWLSWLPSWGQQENTSDKHHLLFSLAGTEMAFLWPQHTWQTSHDLAAFNHGLHWSVHFVLERSS